MTLLPFHRPISLRPATVFGPTILNADSTVHRVDNCGGSFIRGTAEALRWRATFCRRCWSGQRCTVCGYPSGIRTFCLDCAFTVPAPAARRLDRAA